MGSNGRISLETKLMSIKKKKPQQLEQKNLVTEASFNNLILRHTLAGRPCS